MRGVIFNIQKYCIQDGPGIRTTVFLKGCPLHCSWCHNPESQSFEREVMLCPSRCTGCGSCIELCPSDALRLMKGNITRDIESCILCGLCTTQCYSNAIKMAGREITAQELVQELKKDIIFYDSSGGGITISGGEPLSQPEFVLELLKLCKKLDIHTVVDTSGFGSSERLMEIAEYTDLFLYDIKLLDDEGHIRYTGVSNELIVENLKRLSQGGKRLWVRIPVIPGINDSEENVKAATLLIKAMHGVEQVNLLPYHHISAEKYRRLDKTYELEAIRPPEKEAMEKIAGLYRAAGVNVLIGG